MFTRSILSVLAAIASLACGSSAGAEAFEPLRAPVHTLSPQPNGPSSGDPLRAGVASWRGRWFEAIGAWSGSSLRSDLLSLTDGAAGRGSRFNFDRGSDDERAGTSSASISLGRLNLNESRSGPTLGVTSQADLDRELAQLRDSINRVRPTPQVSLGMRVKF